MSYSNLLNDFKIIPLNSKLNKKKSKKNKKSNKNRRDGKSNVGPSIQSPIHEKKDGTQSDTKNSTEIKGGSKTNHAIMDPIVESDLPKTFDVQQYEKEVKKYYTKKYDRHYKQFILNLLNKN